MKTALFIYLASTVVSFATHAFTTFIKYNQIKKAGYEIINKKETLITIFNEYNITAYPYVFIIDLLPVINAAMMAVDIIAQLSEYKYDVKKELQQQGYIAKSEELLKLEADILIKKEKFEEAKKELSSGKMGSYSQMNTINKLNYINELENNLTEDNNENYGSMYNNLTIDEKKKLLLELRREILKDTEININKKEKAKMKKKKM